MGQEMIGVVDETMGCYHCRDLGHNNYHWKLHEKPIDFYERIPNVATQESLLSTHIGSLFKTQVTIFVDEYARLSRLSALQYATTSVRGKKRHKIS